MSPQRSRLTTVQTALGLIFVLSMLLFLLLSPAAGRILSPSAEEPIPQPGPVEIGTVLAAVTSLITAAVALIGLISTVILGWRRDAREARQAVLQQQLTELQIARERQVVEADKKH